MTQQSQPTLSRRHFLGLSAAGVVGLLGQWGFDLTPDQAEALLARRQGASLRVAWGKPAILDPLVASADSEIAFFNAVYDYLVDTDSAANLVPRLAESWQISEDARTFTLTLRGSATFHSGEALTADDVLFTLAYLRSADGPVKDLLSAVENISADGLTLTFQLSTPNPDFLYNLSDNRIVILQKDAADIGKAFNGTGPFIWNAGESEAGVRDIFDANPNYWGGAPSISRLEFFYFDDNQAQISALQGGTVDVLLRMDNASFLALTADPNFAPTDIPTSGHDLARLRADRAPGNDERVQRAFKLATDRQAIYERIQLGFGSVGKDHPIGPAFGAFYADDLNPAPRDPEAAKALLAEAGYPDGLDLTFYVPRSGDRPALAEALQAQWAEAGIRVSIEVQDEATYYADSGWLEVDLGITGWGARPIPQLYLEQYVKGGVAYNEAHLDDPELNALIAQAGSSADNEVRKAAYRRIQEILIERGPFIISYFFAQFMVTAAGISGIEVHPFAGRTRFDRATFS
jgi:peptide/nickel transport system substrate-binding protein